MEVKSEFEVIVTQDFKVDPRYTGLTQEQLDWLLVNIFWVGVSTDSGHYKLTFLVPLPDQEGMTE